MILLQPVLASQGRSHDSIRYVPLTVQKEIALYRSRRGDYPRRSYYTQHPPQNELKQRMLQEYPTTVKGGTNKAHGQLILVLALKSCRNKHCMCTPGPAPKAVRKNHGFQYKIAVPPPGR